MAKVRRVAAVVLTALVLFVMTFSLFVIAHEAEHDCTGADCPVCEIIAVCRNTLKTLAGAVIITAVLFSARHTVFRLLSVSGGGSWAETPVSLKVMLLD